LGGPNQFCREAAAHQRTGDLREGGTGQFLNLQTLEVCLAVIDGGTKVDAIMADVL